MIEAVKKQDATILVIFGAVGDLGKRKLGPAVYNLFLDNWLPDNFILLGVSHHEHDDNSFKSLMKESIDEFSRNGKVDEERWEKFSKCLKYFRADFTDKKSIDDLHEEINTIEKDWNKSANRIFYLSVSPRFVDTISKNLSESGAASNKKKARIIVEKPFGRDLNSAKELNKSLTKCFDESQIYRIDHYLGKETV